MTLTSLDFCSLVGFFPLGSKEEELDHNPRETPSSTLKRAKNKDLKFTKATLIKCWVILGYELFTTILILSLSVG